MSNYTDENESLDEENDVEYWENFWTEAALYGFKPMTHGRKRGKITNPQDLLDNYSELDQRQAISVFIDNFLTKSDLFEMMGDFPSYDTNEIKIALGY